MTDERPESLAAQAAAWVPPWERAPREPDRAYQATAAEPDISDEIDMPYEAAADEPDLWDENADEPDVSEENDDQPSVSGGNEAATEPDVSDGIDEPASADADVADRPSAVDHGTEPRAIGGEARTADAPAGDGPDGVAWPGEQSEAEMSPPPLPGETTAPATVDEPAELPDDRGGPTDVGVGPELPVPTPIEEATEAADGDEAGAPVDAPALPDGDDAGDVAGPAADDDLSEPGAADGDRGADDSDRRADDGDRRADDAAGVARAAAAAIPAQSVARRASAAAAGAPETRTDDDGGLDGPPLDDAELRAALEAILLVVDEPVAEMQLAQIMEQPTERVAAMLEDISARYTAAGHGFDLRRAAGGWRLYTRPEYAAYVERFVLDGQSVRLTQAALETLAVVAYKQPVTRSRISAIRGVNCDGVMRTLATRGLIEECGTEPETGAHLYRTTALFLEKLGLNSVDQLPPLAPFLPDDVEEVLDASG